MQRPKMPAQPLSKIALSCSGGGYRATSFHLGSMSYLHHLTYHGKPLLENVKFLSTVSGGTITGVVYALQTQQGKSFREIYQFLLHAVYELDLVKTGILQLNPGTTWKNPYKKKNLINAFAEQYDQYFTGGATFEVFNEMKCHLEAVAFNSTEFDNGVNFRFRNKGTGYFGNSYIRIPGEAAEEVKLADAIAASSAFPGGFEPMLWPDDFIHSKADKLKELKTKVKTTGLMDGGIYDNQGIDSILKYKSKSDPPYFDLVIISDVTSAYMKPFKHAEDQPKKGWRQFTMKEAFYRLRRINRAVGWGLVAMALITGLAPALWNYSNSTGTGVLLAMSGGFLVGLLAKKFVVKRIVRLWDGLKGLLQKSMPAFCYEKLSLLKIEDISIRRAEPLVLDRLNSVMTMVGDIFLKVIRRLNYGKVYADERWRYRRVSNLIRELTEEDFNRKNNEDLAAEEQEGKVSGSILTGSYEEVVGPEIRKVVEAASSFGTTLWFTEDNRLAKMLDMLVAAGQCTMCYNMLDYFENIIYDKESGFEELDPVEKSAMLATYEQCKKDWVRFKVEPFFLMEEYGNSTT